MSPPSPKSRDRIKNTTTLHFSSFFITDLRFEIYYDREERETAMRETEIKMSDDAEAEGDGEMVGEERERFL